MLEDVVVSWREVSENVDEVRHYSPTFLNFEALVVRCMVGHCHERVRPILLTSAG